MIAAAALLPGDAGGEHLRIRRGRYGAWLHVAVAFVFETLIFSRLAYPLGFLSVTAGAKLGVPQALDVTLFECTMGVFGLLASVTIFRRRWRTIEAFSSYYCTGFAALSLAYVPLVALIYANYRAVLKLRGR